MICIYAIKNTKSGKMYIGSTNNMTRRYIRHRTELNTNRHPNEYLQRSWNKYGEESFDFIILTTCGEHQLLKKEVEYIDKYHSLDATFGYNLTLPKKVATRNISKEHSKKLSDAKKGITPTNFEEMQKTRWKSVDFYIYGKFVENYVSVKKASEALGVSSQTILNVMKGKTKVMRTNPSWNFKYKTEKR
jgi:group I intron endonuclease